MTWTQTYLLGTDILCLSNSCPYYYLTSHVHSHHEPFKVPSPFLTIHQNSLIHSNLPKVPLPRGLPYTILLVKSDLFLIGASILPLVPLITDCCPAGQLLLQESCIIIFILSIYSDALLVTLRKKEKTCISHGNKIEKSRLSRLKEIDSGVTVHRKLPWATLLATSLGLLTQSKARGQIPKGQVPPTGPHGKEPELWDAPLNSRLLPLNEVRPLAPFT